jgi:hypothetical protein
MRRTAQQQSEDKRLQAYMDQYNSSGPVIQIYRLGEKQDGKRWRKRTKVGEIPFDENIHLEAEVQRQFGRGEYLARAVRSNGTWGPSRVIRIG